MTPHSRRRPRLAIASSFPLLALLAAACGSPSEDPGSDVPDFSGGFGGSGAASPAPTTPGAGPDAPGAAPDPSVTPGEAPGDIPLAPTPSQPGETPTAQNPQTPVTPPEQPAQPGDPQQPVEPQPVPTEPDPDRPTRGTSNLFTDLLGIPVGEVDAKVRTAVERVFGIGTGESATPDSQTGFRIYYELPQDPSKAFIWCADNNDVRSEGQSYGMMIAVQMNMQQQFDKLWKFAKENMQITGGVWNRYFNWQGAVSVNGNSINVNFGNSGPAPDGDEYFTAALYLADRRWGSNGAFNYEAEADAIASALLNNTGGGGGQTALFNQGSNMVVFYPNGNAATFSDPSYHLPAFYEIFAQDGNAADANRWRQIAATSRQFFVSSANPNTGLHPDYAGFNGAAVDSNDGQNHNHFKYDAWRVPMNMAIDYAWTGPDQRLTTQVDKYHAFFLNNGHVGENNVVNALFQLNGQLSADGGGSSTALTQTLAAGALATTNEARVRFVENAWNVGQQSGFYRYYQESVYLLGLLATAGWYGYEWAPPAQ